MDPMAEPAAAEISEKRHPIISAPVIQVSASVTMIPTSSLASSDVMPSHSTAISIPAEAAPAMRVPPVESVCGASCSGCTVGDVSESDPKYRKTSGGGKRTVAGGDSVVNRRLAAGPEWTAFVQRLPYHIRLNIFSFFNLADLSNLALACTNELSSEAKQLRDVSFSFPHWESYRIKIHDFENGGPGLFQHIQSLQKFLSSRIRQIYLDFRDVTQNEMRYYLHRVSELSRANDTILDFMNERVVEVDLSETSFDDIFITSHTPIVFNILKDLRQVQTLRLSNCRWLSEAEVRTIRFYRNIFHIDVSQNSGLDDQFARHITTPLQVEGPVFNNGLGIGAAPSFHPLGQVNCFSLTILNLLEVPNLETHGIRMLCQHFTELRQLYLDGEGLHAYNGAHLVKLTKLHTLHIMYINENLEGDFFLQPFLDAEEYPRFINLKLTQKQFPHHSLQQFLEKCLSPQASVLELTDAGVTDQIVTTILQTTASLKVLHLDWNRQITDTAFSSNIATALAPSKFTKLEHFSLVGCDQVFATHGDYAWFQVADLNRNFPRLRYISFEQCDFVNDETLKEIRQYRNELKIQNYHNESVDCCGQQCCFPENPPNQ